MDPLRKLFPFDQKVWLLRPLPEHRHTVFEGSSSFSSSDWISPADWYDSFSSSTFHGGWVEEKEDWFAKTLPVTDEQIDGGVKPS